MALRSLSWKESQDLANDGILPFRLYEQNDLFFAVFGKTATQPNTGGLFVGPTGRLGTPPFPLNSLMNPLFRQGRPCKVRFWPSVHKLWSCHTIWGLQEERHQLLEVYAQEACRKLCFYNLSLRVNYTKILSVSQSFGDLWPSRSVIYC